MTDLNLRCPCCGRWLRQGRPLGPERLRCKRGSVIFVDLGADGSILLKLFAKGEGPDLQSRQTSSSAPMGAITGSPDGLLGPNPQEALS